MKKDKSFKTKIWEELDERGWVTPLSQPPEEFVQWWANHDHARKLITVRGRKVWDGKLTADKAWMIADYRDEFKVRGHENAAGTGVNYAYFGWWRSHQKPMTSNPAILAEHRKWLKDHQKPDPVKEEFEVPGHIRNANSFDELKTILAQVGENVDMNKAIGWTEADSKAANEQPF